MEESDMRSLKGIAIATVFAMVSTVALAAGETSTEPSAWDKFKAYTHQQKQEALAEGKKLVAETDEKIDELKAQARESSAETKAAYRRNMRDLQHKEREAKVKLAKLEKASSSAWDATKEGFANAYHDLHRSYEKAVAAAKK
jgi:Spy/CpxP family protein refolding chaperone